jgi:integrase
LAADRYGVSSDSFSRGLITEYGKPFTANGFGNKFKDWCRQADLPHCSAHGVRKAISTALAEAGATPHEIMAVTGHQTLEEVATPRQRTEKNCGFGKLTRLVFDRGLKAPAQRVGTKRPSKSLGSCRSAIELRPRTYSIKSGTSCTF